MDKTRLNEAEICDAFITPAIIGAGWDQRTQIRREYTFTDGRVIVRGTLGSRGKKKRADYLLFYQSNLPLAVVEAKDNSHPVGGGMQQALGSARSVILATPSIPTVSSRALTTVFSRRSRSCALISTRTCRAGGPRRA